MHILYIFEIVVVSYRSIVELLNTPRFLSYLMTITIRLEIPLAPVVTENLAQVPEMAQEKIDQSLDPALLEHLVKRNFKILQNDPYLLAIEELHGMVRT